MSLLSALLGICCKWMIPLVETINNSSESAIATLVDWCCGGAGWFRPINLGMIGSAEAHARALGRIGPPEGNAKTTRRRTSTWNIAQKPTIPVTRCSNSRGGDWTAAHRHRSIFRIRFRQSLFFLGNCPFVLDRTNRNRLLGDIPRRRP